MRKPRLTQCRRTGPGPAALQLLVACLIIWLALGGAAAGPLEQGLEAYNRGDFATAGKLWRDAAEAGNATAMNNLGIMYDLGKGVPRSDKLAIFWFTKAARLGHPKAQFNLGRKFDNGEGVTANEVTAYMWYVLAASSGTKAFIIQRDAYAKFLTPEEIQTAHQLARQWIAAHEK